VITVGAHVAKFHMSMSEQPLVRFTLYGFRGPRILLALLSALTVEKFCCRRLWYPTLVCLSACP